MHSNSMIPEFASPKFGDIVVNIFYSKRIEQLIEMSTVGELAFSKAKLPNNPQLSQQWHN